MTDWNEPGTAEGTVVEAKWPKLGPSKIVKNTRIGVASDFWNRYEEDIQLSKDIGWTHRPRHFNSLLKSRAGVLMALRLALHLEGQVLIYLCGQDATRSACLWSGAACILAGVS